MDLSSLQLTTTPPHNADGHRQQIDAIDRLNDDPNGIRLLKGLEVNILKDGMLNLPDGVLEQLHLRVYAIQLELRPAGR